MKAAISDQMEAFSLKTSYSWSRFRSDWIGLDWIGLVWFGLVWFGLVWFGWLVGWLVSSCI